MPMTSRLDHVAPGTPALVHEGSSPREHEVSTPLGDFVRTRRDATGPELVGLPAGGRRRAPGLRRSELAALADISVEYLVRIEQGRDHNPSVSVVNALADALQLDPTEREHLRYLAKLSSGSCLGGLAELRLDVRPTVRMLLEQVEPGIAMVTNRLGDVLAYTSGFDQLARPTGLLDARVAEPDPLRLQRPPRPQHLSGLGADRPRAGLRPPARSARRAIGTAHGGPRGRGRPRAHQAP